MRKTFRISQLACVSLAALASLSGQAAFAQEDGEELEVTQDEESLDGRSRDDMIVVTGTKRAGGVAVQDAPLAVTLFGANDLAEANVRDISAIGNLVPNVVFNGASTIPGTATLSIRGMAINNTIPSSTPTVGVFLDGVYIGVSSGLVLDNFDMEGIEILRGPQGLLFGRNVTGGAVLLRTTTPTSYEQASASISLESGPLVTASASVSGPLSDNFLYKFAIYHSDDSGWFENLFDGESFGESTNTRFNAALTFLTGETSSTTLRASYGETKGDGPAIQNHGVYSRNSHDFNINETGFFDLEYFQVSAETELNPGTDNGEIVNIIAFRTVTQDNLTDFDGQPADLFTFDGALRQRQFSNELRYADELGPLSFTTGVYFYADHLEYYEGRTLFGGASRQTGGGIVESQTYAVFSTLDYEVLPGLILNLGARYSIEEKQAQVSRISPDNVSPCSVENAVCTSFAFTDSDTWKAFTPKVGLQWEPTPYTHIYGFWTRGNRSGGYNVRQASAGAPGPYDQEVLDAFEIGVKQQLFDNRIVVNLAAFINEYDDIQRDISRPDPIFGTVQVTDNTANVRIQGVEGEFSADVTDNLVITANFGYLDSKFLDILTDISGDGVVDAIDFGLELPLLAEWSYGASAVYTVPIDGGDISTRVAFNHRDSVASTDSNVGFLNPMDNLDAGITLNLRNGLTFSIYGKNLTNETYYGFDVPLPFLGPGTTHSPLGKGRVIGISARFSM